MADSGYFLSEFADFVEATGPARVEHPRQLINQALRYDYPFSEMCYGENAGGKVMIQGGNPIRQNMVFKGSGVGKKYKIGSFQNWENPQRLQRATTYLRYFITHKTWNDAEIILNEVISKGTKGARFEQYVKIDDEKEMLMWIDTHEKLDSYLFTVPDATTMEGEDGMDHMSLFAINNEEDRGLFGTEAGAPWTTVFGLSPTSAAVDGRWQPQRKGYASIADAPGATTLTTTDLCTQLESLMDDCMFKQPKTHAEWWVKDDLRSYQIWTTKQGRNNFKRALKNGQDHWVAGPQDPAYSDPTMRGIPVKRVQHLETAAVYYDSTGTPNYTTEGTAAESGATNAWYTDSASVGHHPGPRYYLFNFNYTFPVFNDERFFYKDKPGRHNNVRDTWTVPMTVWHNIFCTSRQHNGVLFPSATGLGGAAYVG